MISLIQWEYLGGRGFFHLNSTQHLASKVQKASMFLLQLSRCTTCGIIPNKEVRGDGSTGTSNILERVSKIDSQNVCIIEQAKSIWSMSAGACLHLSHVGSRSGLILDRPTFDQWSLWTILNWTTCFWQMEDVLILCIIFAQVSSHLSPPPTAVYISVCKTFFIPYEIW